MKQMLRVASMLGLWAVFAFCSCHSWHLPFEGSSLFPSSTRFQLEAGYQIWHAHSDFWSSHGSVPLKDVRAGYGPCHPRRMLKRIWVLDRRKCCCFRADLSYGIYMVS